MQTIASEEDLKSFVTDNSTKTIALFFTATWAEQCKNMLVVFSTLAQTYQDSVKFFEIDAEKYSDIADSYSITSVPSFIIIKSNKVIDRPDATAQAITASIVKYSQPQPPVIDAPLPITPNTSQRTPTPAELTQKIKTLIISHPLMIFIKGTPSAPKCKFTKEMIEILTKLDVGYGSFNILNDEQVRSGLKEFSDWPTFPQVYINGKFVGGLDILKEMISTGEFLKMLPTPEDSLNKRLAALINSSPVIVFIKGTKTEPKCGFSRQIIQILGDEGVDFETFDILEDEDVRQGLKEFSSWPTFPQVYVRGEFIGGLDIVKEMVESGEKIA